MRVVILLAAVPVLGLGQTRLDPAIQTTVCDVLKAPELFNGKIVTLRGEIQIDFERFNLQAQDCAGQKADDALWLEYGRGPKRQPTIWCCGDMVPRDGLAMLQDTEFRQFHRYLTARKDPHKYYDYLYRVTATLTGRFDSREPQDRGCFGFGFGHFGASCARLVIQRVSNVVAVPAAP